MCFTGTLLLKALASSVPCDLSVMDLFFGLHCSPESPLCHSRKAHAVSVWGTYLWLKKAREEVKARGILARGPHPGPCVPSPGWCKAGRNGSFPRGDLQVDAGDKEWQNSQNTSYKRVTLWWLVSILWDTWPYCCRQEISPGSSSRAHCTHPFCKFHV